MSKIAVVAIVSSLPFIYKMSQYQYIYLYLYVKESFHAQVAEMATRDRKSSFQKHNDTTHVRSPNFQVGDCACRRTPQERYVQVAG
jgi:hypothetical protein